MVVELVVELVPECLAELVLLEAVVVGLEAMEPLVPELLACLLLCTMVLNCEGDLQALGCSSFWPLCVGTYVADSVAASLKGYAA